LAALAADAPRFATRSLAHPENSTSAQKPLVDLIRAFEMLMVLAGQPVEREVH